MVFAGDFNCVLDTEMDRTNDSNNGAKKSDRSRGTLRRMVGSRMADAYRSLYPLGVSYTFTGNNGYRARLDRIYVETELAESIEEVCIQAVCYSDPHLVTVYLGKQHNRQQWGRGRWILNSKLLFDEATREEIKECVDCLRAKKHQFSSILERWDIVKLKVKETFINNGIRIQKEKFAEQRSIERELGRLLSKRQMDKDDTDNIRFLK